MRDISGEVMLFGAVLAALIWMLVVLLLGRPRKPEGSSRFGKCAATEDADVGLVVTLVHGTAGWRSSWLRERSRLRAHLESTFPGRIEFCRVSWSGLNSFKARRNGAVSLRRQIRENANRWPEARQVVVAHSHGGSLSIEALNDDDCSKKVDGLVCMATPFLTLTRYRLPLVAPSLQFLFDFAAVYALAILVYVTLRCLLPGWAFDCLAAFLVSIYDWFLPKDLMSPSFVDYMVLIFGRFVLPVTVVLSLGWMARRWAGHCESVVVAALQDSRLEPDKVLILRQPGDEAAGAIAGLHAATLPLGLIIKLTSSLLAPIEAARRRAKATRFGKYWAGWVGVAAASAAAAAALRIAMSSMSTTSAEVGLLAFFAALDLIPLTAVIAMFAIYALTSAVMAVATLVALAHLLSLVPAIFSVGPEMLFAGSRLKVTAEAAPMGTWRVVTIPMRARLARERPVFGDLWHSYLYESEAAITEIGSWMQKRLCRQKDVCHAAAGTEPDPRGRAADVC